MTDEAIAVELQRLNEPDLWRTEFSRSQDLRDEQHRRKRETRFQEDVQNRLYANVLAALEGRT